MMAPVRQLGEAHMGSLSCRSVRLVAAAVLGLGVVALPAGAASGATTDACATVLVPGAPEVLDDSDVAAALDTLVADGVTPWVRVWKSVPGGDLDAAVRTAAARCDGVAGDPDGLAPDVVVLAVSMQDRKSGIYFGSTWDAELAGAWEATLDSEVDPLLAGGDVPGAVAAGLAAVDGLVTPGGGTSVDSFVDSGGVDSGGVDTGTDPFADPTVVADCSDLAPGLDAREFGCPSPNAGGGVVVAVVGGGVAVIAAAFAGAGWNTRRRLRDDAVLAAGLAATARTEVESGLAQAREAADRLVAGLADDDAAGVRDRVEALAATAAAGLEVADVQERLHPRAGVGALSSAQARAATSGWNAVTERLGDVRADVASLRAALDAEAAAVAAVATDLDAAESELGTARERVAAAGRDGFTVDVQTALLDGARAALVVARADAAAGRALTAARTVAQARRTVVDAVAQAEGLPARRDAVLAAATAVAERMDAVRAAATSAAERFTRLRDGYDDSLWTDLAADVEDAPARVEQATAAVEEAQVAASMRAQRWDDAETAADRARAAADGVEDVAERAGSRLAAVEEAERALPQRFRQVSSAYDDAARYLRRHRRDVPSDVAGRIEKAGAVLTRVAHGLQEPKPAWLRLRDDVAATATAVDVAYAAAKQAVREAECRRDRSSSQQGALAAGSIATFSSGSSGSSGFDGGSSGGGSMGGGSSSW